MAKATITNIDLQNGTDRTVFVTWTWEKLSQTDKYDIRWYYATNDGVRFIGSEEQKSITNAQLQSTYTAPEHATLVKFQVKPIAKTHKVNGKDVAYWTAEWSTEAVYNFSNNPPSVPPTPSVTVKDYTLTAKLDNLNVNATEVQFQIVRNDSSVYKTGTAKIITNSVSYSVTIEAGYEYKVRCRAKRGTMYSGWSEYSNNVSTIAGVPTMTDCRAASSTSIYISWTNVSGAETYDIEYATKERYLYGSNATTTVNGITASMYTITGLESGQKYFIRVRAVNAQGSSGWSKIVTVTIGERPAAPTTWASTTTAMVGEKITLYWVHNSEDGSTMSYAEIELCVDGTTTYQTIETGDIDNEDDNDNDNETIHQYIIDTSGAGVYKDGAQIQWRVKTAGINQQYGEWSVQRTIDVYAPPTLSVSITNGAGGTLDKPYLIDSKGNYLLDADGHYLLASPGLGDMLETDVLTRLPLYITAKAGPSSQTAIGYHVSIIANESYETIDEVGNIKIVCKGDSVYSRYYDVNVNDILLQVSAESVDFENNITYTVICGVTMNTGLSAEEEITFQVLWEDDIYEPNAEIGIDYENLSAHIRPYCEYEDGTLVDGVTLSVYRREYDGRFVEIATGLKNTDNTFITDPHPSLDYARYRIVAISDFNGGVSYTDISGYYVGEKTVVIQWNETWQDFDALGEDPQEERAWSGSMLKLPYNIDVSDTNELDVTLVEYIGRSRPVSYYGTQLGSKATINTDIPKNDKNTLYALRRLAIWAGDVYIREPSGSGYWANISVSFSKTHCELVIPVTISITRVEGGI